MASTKRLCLDKQYFLIILEKILTSLLNEISAKPRQTLMNGEVKSFHSRGSRLVHTSEEVVRSGLIKCPLFYSTSQ